MGNISVIQAIENDFPVAINFTNTEASRDNQTVPSGGTKSDGAHVPWCDSADQFPQHHIAVTAPDSVYYIYQSGPSVWGSASGFGVNATVLGDQGYNYRLTVAKDFTISLTAV